METVCYFVAGVIGPRGASVTRRKYNMKNTTTYAYTSAVL